MNIKIDNLDINLPAGITVLQAAAMAGIEIPTMCYGGEDYHNHPSCMLCVVKDAKSGRLLPSCASKAEEGMEILTRDDEIIQARREALELLMSDHVGDCEAPCRVACPAFMDIPQMMRLIAADKIAEALSVVRREIALPLILGYICEAPCEKVCRRASVDAAVSICQLKKFVAAEDLKHNKPHFPEKQKPSGKKVAIIGSGPAGLACAFHLVEAGYQAIIFERETQAGGALLQISSSRLPAEARTAEIKWLREFGLEFRLGQAITREVLNSDIRPQYNAVVLATGSEQSETELLAEFNISDKNPIASPETCETSIAGIFACGSIIREQKMAVKALAQGKLAAQSVIAFLKDQKPLPRKRQFNSKFGKLRPEEIPEYLKESIEGGRLEPRYGYLKGFAPAEARKEAQRCLHCDCRKVDDCKLRSYSDLYQIDRRKYADGIRNSLTKNFSHKAIVYEAEKCIRCGLCIEVAKAEKTLAGLSFIGRGFTVKVDIPFNRSMEEALQATALKCAELCPTGAIAKKAEAASIKK